MRTLVLALCLAGMGLTGCHKSATAPPVPGAPTQSANREWVVTKALGSLQKSATSAADIAISLNKSGVMTTEQTRQVITWARPAVAFTQDALKIMQTERPLQDRIASVLSIMNEVKKIPALQGAIPDGLLANLLTAQQAINDIGGN